MMKRLLVVLPMALLAACTTTQSAFSAQPAMQPQQMAMATPSPFDIHGQAIQQLQAQTTTQISSLGERVRRVERAMIRLDRRMQVIERGEMARMSGAEDHVGGGFQPTSYTEATPNQFSQLASPFSRGAAVLNRGIGTGQSPMLNALRQQQPQAGMITSALQAAPQQQFSQPVGAGAPRLASLADKTDAAADASTQVAVWSVNYQADKIWPSREELAASTQIVTALRDSQRPVTLFARGADPASREFRERVRAISRYLGRVANMDNVPIAALPAEHLGDETIEILAAH